MRLIDADAIHYCNYDLDNYHSFRAVDEDEIADMPTIDAVPVVRCKDCKWYRCETNHYGTEQRFCNRHSGLVCVNENTFCFYGERKDNDG